MEEIPGGHSVRWRARGDVMISRSIRRTVLVGFSALTFVGQGLAADLFAVPDADYCAVAGTSNLVLTDIVAMLDEYRAAPPRPDDARSGPAV